MSHPASTSVPPTPAGELLTTPFTAASTTHDVIKGVDLTGRRAVVTGATSGLGTETARALAAAGAEVTLAVRDLRAGERVAAGIQESVGGAVPAVARLDTSDPASAASFGAAWEGPLHILVNSAGIMAAPEQHTPQGLELHFATNHVGHFALAHGLHGALAQAGDARIVAVSSALHLASPVVFDDINFRYRPYHPFVAYGQSKTANVLFVVEAARRWAADGITANAAMPGYILTNLQRHVTESAMAGMTRFRVPEPKSVEQGAATAVLLAASPLTAGVTGRYFEDCNEAAPAPDHNGWIEGVAPFALDPAHAARLWDYSESLLPPA
ncbi:NAD(P)-dependent dehydrogenase, short-chain alcohol dehydrogenase family [Streptomyces sp. DvalAA-14]|uniref:SDR family NAD(P)-dependent oxidoreductase n=1 Tax=unclassified Streptomyces TaxID=2593676 RepID=UPI00081B5E1D|nr:MULTISPECIES: SDR family NAD(P)-dependent oxidoreductase [unclassified Streptomyces]MYS21762.1 SDR family NAD(P)-dependent oxidoreductase [Streptomyces sp. SID4948]SCE00812.1 NAD(P)-dependent dehydrogenase, short-chain alcohol dehydrogenase family [Streptomyces sp. DvalAA-14]